MRRSIRATPAARSSTWTARWSAISTAIVSPSGGSVGIGFAMPSELVMPIVDQLRGQRPYRARLARRIGGRTADNGVTDRRRRARPARRRAPASRQGDMILAVNGERDRQLARADPHGRRGAAGQQRVSLSIRRQGREIDVPVTVGRRPAGGAGLKERRLMRILVVEDDKDVGGFVVRGPEGGRPRGGTRRQRPRRSVHGGERDVRRGDPRPHAARRHRRPAAAGDAARRRRTPCRC